MQERDAFQYAILRVVPSVERGERMNVGVALHCPRRRFLGVGGRTVDDEVAEPFETAAVARVEEFVCRCHAFASIMARGEPVGGPRRTASWR